MSYPEGAGQTPQHRSVSQLLSYSRCPYSYKLARIDKAWERPAAWFAQGLAVHEVIEYWENSGRTATEEELANVYAKRFDAEINRSGEETPYFDDWFASGPYPALTDIPRRFEIGWNQVERYTSYYQRNPDEVCIAAELDFEVDLDGVMVRGSVDNVVALTNGDLVVRDTKTGTSVSDPIQLHVYGLALRRTGYATPSYGQFMMLKNRTRVLGPPVYFEDMAENEIIERFRVMDAGVRAGKFPPRPSAENCERCAVRASCEFAE